MDFLFEVKHPVFTVKYFIYIISIDEVFLSGIHSYEFIWIFHFEYFKSSI